MFTLEYGRRPRPAAGLRRALTILGVAVAAIVAAGWLAYEAVRPTTRAEAVAEFQRDLRLPEGVSLVRVHPRCPDYHWEIGGVTVVFDDTGVVARLTGRHADLTAERDHLLLSSFAGQSVGNATFGEAHHIVTKTGERRPSWSYHVGLDLGPAGPFAGRFSEPIQSVADLRDRQDEVLALLRSLPQHPAVGTHDHRGHERRITVFPAGGPARYPMPDDPIVPIVLPGR